LETTKKKHSFNLYGGGGGVSRSLRFLRCLKDSEAVLKPGEILGGHERLLMECDETIVGIGGYITGR